MFWQYFAAAIISVNWINPQFSRQPSPPTEYQVLYRVPIPKMQSLVAQAESITNKITSLESEIKKLRADKKKRKENRDKIREKSARVLELKDELRAKQVEIKAPPAYLFCYNSIKSDAIVIICESNDLKRRASHVDKGDYIRVRRDAKTNTEILSFQRIAEPTPWPPLPLSIRFPAIILTADDFEITANLSSERSGQHSIEINIHPNPKPSDQRFITYGSKKHITKVFLVMFGLSIRWGIFVH